MTTPGLCECGCGGRTNVSERPGGGYAAGVPRRFIAGHQNRKRTPEFVVTETGMDTPCWLWIRGTNSGGYGQFHIRRWPVAAHRYYYELWKGPIPEGLQIDHLCRRRNCVNPDHLEAVTHAENARRGKNTRLTAEDVAQIRARRDEPTRVLAKEFGITVGYVSDVRCGRKWAE